VQVVLDTNILLSALRSGGSPAQIVDAWRAGRFRLVTSAAQIEEFKRAAAYPKLRPHLPRGAVGRVVNELRTAEVLLRRLRRPGTSPDPGDEYLLAMALAAGADLLMTGDKPLLALKRVGKTRIVSGRRFASMLARQP
jgi:putative PIN family toxin of toxin-antitoxin system